MKKYIVTLTEDEREFLSELTSKGKHKSQKIINSLILLGCDEGEFQKKRSPNKEIARVLNISMKKIDRVSLGHPNQTSTPLLPHDRDQPSAT